LASANPTESRYNPNRSVVDNIQLPPTLLSRFDLIYLILDAPNVDHDRRLAQHLVGLYYETPNVVEPPMDQALLRDYIEYARQNIHPEISDEAASYLIDSYLEMRNPSNGSGGGAVLNNGTRTISATARQLESLIRISEALAKMRYSNMVTRNDAKEAIRLMKVATQAAATDPRTGKIDMDMITTGRSSNTREMEEQLDIALQELFRERRGTQMKVRDVIRQLMEINNVSLPQDDILEGVRRMHADGHVQFNERTQTIFIRTSV
jgi:DNA replication licensing factor MCM4